MLDKPVKDFLRTTSRHVQGLKTLGIETLEDFLTYFPRAYKDESELTKVINAKIGEINVMKGTLGKIFSRKTNSGKFMIRADFMDETGLVEVVWFNQIYLSQILKNGMQVILSGKIKYDRGRLSLLSPIVEVLKQEQIHTARIVPVYREHEVDDDRKHRSLDLKKTRISSKWLREKIKPLLKYATYFDEYLPHDLIERQDLMSFEDAIRKIHFPASETALDEAKRRLAFDELFMIQYLALYRRWKWRENTENLRVIKKNQELHESFLESLPFELTGAQKRVLDEIFRDFSGNYPMLRLLQGDVGSGKTVLAAAVALQVIRSGYQTVLMAPTEILAWQHFETLLKMLERFEIHIEFLAGSTSQKSRNQIFAGMMNGQIDLVIGTHALIQEKIVFHNLGLAIIDEQHRFGVKQRNELKKHSSPHLLAMTATPIPRTLAMTLYGDQDLSVLDEMPPGRQEIVTRIVPEYKRNDAYLWVNEQVKKGRQVFVICPLIDESDALELKSAVSEFEVLSRVFKDFKLGLLHGRLTQNEKDQVMREFSCGKINILVSTSVVEVGIDVQNATIILIEGAERFGLSQLHQFRGRVGRGKHQSYCFVFTSKDSKNGIQRLKALVEYNDGFKLSEIDLRLRGPGEVYGVRQSGIPDLKIASFLDHHLIEQARKEAEILLNRDPELKAYVLLKKKLQTLASSKD